MNKKITIIITFLIVSAELFTQQRLTDARIQEELEFISYLTDKGFFEESTYALKILRSKPGLDFNTEGRIDLLLGHNYLKINEYDSANKYFLEAGSFQAYCSEAKFYGSYINLELKDYEKSLKMLQDMGVSGWQDREMRNFQMAAIHLLNRDIRNFNDTQKDIQYHVMANESKKLDEIALEIQNFRRRSPVLAGTLSAIVPGTGKAYAGKPLEGLSSFFITALFGAFTYESYRKAGISDFKTIVLASVFTVHYVGNIWGSIFTVKRRRNEFNYEMDRKILNDIHITLDKHYL